MRYLKIKDDLYLKQDEINIKEEETIIQTPINRIEIIDRSGSMTQTLPQLIEDLIQRVKNYPKNDIVTIGWFSSEGSYNWIVKGFKISDDADYKTLETIIRKNSSALNLTCFSEILADTKNVIEDLKPMSNRFCLSFFSDGVPVVSNYRKEIANIFKAIEDINFEIANTLIVGYGPYYNKNLLSEMAEKFGGALTHSSNIKDYSTSITELVEKSKDSVGRISIGIDCPYPDDILFSVNGDVTLYKYDSTTKGIWFTPSQRGKNWLFTITKQEPKGEEVKLTDSNVDYATSKINHFVKGVYAASLILSQKCDNEKALSVMGVLGDKYFVDKINNAFTNEEYGAVEGQIRTAISNPNSRFVKGRNVNYLPKDDAFCVLDLLEMLSNDKDVCFLPRHPNFKYKKIGVTSVPKEGYPKFEADPDVKCYLQDFVWNKEFLNLSILTKIPGTITLPKNYKKFGFQDKLFRTFVWRNYTIIKSGILNVEMLPVTLPTLLEEKLDELIPVEKGSDGVCTLHLNLIPVMNRSIAKGYTSATDLFISAITELKLQAQLKVLKYKRNLIAPEKELPTTGFEGLTEKQVEYLMDLGIDKKGCYSPPSDKLESTDYYIAKKMSIKIDKFSSLPSIDSVLKKISAGKSLTSSDGIIAKYLDMYRDLNSLEDIDKFISANKMLLKKQRDNMQRAKFAVIMGKSWFSEFSSREDCILTINDYTVTLILDEDKVEY